jgi:hypothetical protein
MSWYEWRFVCVFTSHSRRLLPICIVRIRRIRIQVGTEVRSALQIQGNENVHVQGEVPVTFGIEIFLLCYRFGQITFGETRNVTPVPA